MPKKFSRHELYELVWSQPPSRLAPDLGVSGVAIAKACLRAEIPVPPRGYWARKAHGKPVFRPPLPKRPFGLADLVIFGGSRPWHHYGPQLSEEDILGPIPPEPEFDETMEAIRSSVGHTIARVSVHMALDRPHPVVSRILKYDEARSEKSKQYGLSSWYAPRYVSPIQRRRLRLISALFGAVALCGCRTSTYGGEPFDGVINDFSVFVGDQHVRVRVVVVETKRRSGEGSDVKTTIDEHIRIALEPGESGGPDRRYWEDNEQRLENQLRDIAVAIVVEGEAQYRAGVLGRHKWRIEQRAKILDRKRQEREEAQRRESERIAELERKRVERLLAEAEAMQQAEAIRRYVSLARDANDRIVDATRPSDFDEWAQWALMQADHMDPVVSGRFRASWFENDP